MKSERIISAFLALSAACSYALAPVAGFAKVQVLSETTLLVEGQKIKASPFARPSLPEMSHGNQEDVSRLFLVDSPLVMTEGTLQHSLPKKALEALVRGDRDEAIKQVLHEAKVSREEATQMVADFLLTQPSLLRRMKDTQSETKWGLMRWLILLQAIAVAIGYFLFFHDQW